MIAEMLQAATTTVNPLDSLADYGAIGLLAVFALLGLIATVVAYRRLSDRFIRYLEHQAEKTSEERAAVMGVLTKLVEAVDRIERRTSQ
ncbi:MAG: hypothetical protein KDI19_16760 [Pseudomonadales bacterium]|nr:hypothetical protein [Pseudomonadales bacterium]